VTIGSGSGPIFIVGSMRSGSTLLRLVLDSHPHIAIPSETGFMGGLRAVKDVPQWKFGARWYERLGWSEDEVDALLRGLYDTLFARYAQAQGKPRWGEKTPFHSNHVAEMARVFPDAVFVGIVRHPGAVAWSLRRFHYRFDEGVDYWASTNAAMVSAGSMLSSRFVLLRYEDLVTNPEPLLRPLLDAVGEPWSARVLHHDEVQREQGAPRAVEGSTVSSDPLDSARADAWASHVDDDGCSALHGVRELAAFLGYDALQPTLLEDRAPLLDGDALAARRRTWAGRLDLDRAPTVPEPDADPRQLARDLLRAEQALARARARRAVRLADAFRKIQHGRSLRDVREAWEMVRRPSDLPSATRR
jgi:hypothetical protein